VAAAITRVVRTTHEMRILQQKQREKFKIHLSLCAAAPFSVLSLRTVYIIIYIYINYECAKKKFGPRARRAR
jgi:hypothetical protein